MALTKGEVVQCAGRLVERVGIALDDEETPDKISLEEALKMLQDTIVDIMKEYSD